MGTDAFRSHGDLLAAGLGPEPFVRRALGLLEADLRALALRALADWEAAGVASPPEPVLAIAALQRPAVGPWHGGLAPRRCTRMRRA